MIATEFNYYIVNHTPSQILSAENIKVIVSADGRIYRQRYEPSKWGVTSGILYADKEIP